MKKTPHFFKVHSRFGLINVPYKWSELNIGVEDGCDAVLSEKFLTNFPNSHISEYLFPNYEAIDQKNYWHILAEHLRKCSELISQSIGENERQVIIGGDHSVTFSSFAAVLKRFDSQKVGYIQFDSQGDIHTISSSYSGNFHGMFVRPFVDTFDDLEIDQLIPHKIPIENVLYIGNLDLEIEETDYFSDKKIKNIVKDDMEKGRQHILDMVHTFIDKFEHIHITFDVDVFHRSLVLATGTPAIDGWMKDDIFQILTILNKHKSFTFDLVEVNPTKPRAEQTISLAQEVLISMLE